MRGTASSRQVSPAVLAHPQVADRLTIVTAASVEHLSAGDLTRSGEAACLLGALQLVDQALARQEGGPSDAHLAGSDVNPEQLLAAGFAACFLGALRWASSQAGARLPVGSAVTADVAHSGAEPGAAGLSVVLRVRLPDLAWEAAEALVHEAHEACPYSHARRDSVDVRLAA